MRLWALPAVLLSAACAAAPCQDVPRIVDVVKAPDRVFPGFQIYVRCGQYADAHKLLTPATHKLLPYEQFYFGVTAFDALRRLITSAEVHVHDYKNGKLRLCNADFGIGREFRLVETKLAGKTFYQLDFNAEDVDYLKNRALGWYKLQAKKADGWHFAYPPDWTYAPLARTCLCGT